jgi:Mg2+ and Co2+ transporter CorA
MSPEELVDYIKEMRRSDQEQLRNARESMEKRLESINEFRGQLRDQAAGFVTREEHSAKHSEIEARLRGVEKLIWMGAGGVAVMQVILHFLK